MEKIIEFKNINFAYDSLNAFNDFSMEIMEGDIVTLIGTSGSGKTTLLKMLCHQLPNETVYYKGREMSSYTKEELQKRVVVIFDSPFTASSCLLELKKYISKIGLSLDEIDARIEKLVKFFSMEPYINKEISKLTKEEAYMIKILRYLIINPSFVAIDCILGCVGQANKKRIYDYIKKNKMTLLVVTTDLDDSLYGNKLFVLENFVLILEGNTLSVLKTDTLLKRLGFKLPLAVDLSIELIHYDVLKKVYTDSEKLVGALWK